MVKALAMRDDLQLATNCYCDLVILELDNLVIVKAFRSNSFLRDLANILKTGLGIELGMALVQKFTSLIGLTEGLIRV